VNENKIIKVILNSRMADEILQHISSSSKLERDKGIQKLSEAINNKDGFTWSSVKKTLNNINKDSEISWEEKHGYLMAQKCLIPVVKDEDNEQDFVQKLTETALKWLTDSEVRVRIASGECLGELCSHFGPQVYLDCRNVVLMLVKNNLERKLDLENKGGAEEIQETGKLMEKLTRNQSWEASNIFHDTAGWKNLETSLSCLQRMVEGLGILATQFIDEELLQLIFICLNHTNRFVRETGFHVCTTFISVCSMEDDKAEDAMEVDFDSLPEDNNPIIKYGSMLTDHLALGLADNWSQVRLAASTAARAFLTTLPENTKNNFYPKLLPRICLNRYYLAEGVRIYSQNTWRQVAGQRGKVLVEKYIEEIVQYYVEATQANNHAVREAACQCIAELANKIDPNILRPHVDRLLHTLIECFKDDSWPVRDMACVAAGSFVKCFPEQSRKDCAVLFDLFFSNLTDPISSVRQGAAIALANSVRAFGNEALEKVEDKIREGLKNIKDQPVESEKYGSFHAGPAEFGVAKKIRDNDISLHENQTMYSCGSLAPKMNRGGSGGCTDAKFRKKSEPWELADGCVHAIAELSKIKDYQVQVSNLLPLVSDACHHKHYVMHLNFFSTVCGRLAEIGENVDKKNFKPYLENFFDMIFYSLECENGLAVSAAEECLKSLSKLLGPNILRGRVENYNPGFIAVHERVLNGPGMGPVGFPSRSPPSSPDNSPGIFPGSTFNSSSRPVGIPGGAQRAPSLGGTPTLGGTPPP